MDKQKDMQVITVVKKDIHNIIIIKNWTDLINYPYNICLDIKKVDRQTKKCLRKTRVINLYDNKIGQRQLWEGFFPILQ